MNKKSKNVPFAQGSLRKGHYLYWKKDRYEISSFSSNQLEIELENLNSGEKEWIALHDLLNMDQTSDEPIFAPTLERLSIEIQKRQPALAPATSVDLPQTFLRKADLIIKVVVAIDRLVMEEERLANVHNGEFRRTAALKRAIRQLEDSICPATYYKYRRIYQRYCGDRNQIAASLRPKTLNQSKASDAVIHFMDTCIMRFYMRAQPIRKSRLYNTMRSIYKRTGGMWVDPDKCNKVPPQNLVDELLDHKLPVAAIFDNPEKAVLLSTIALPGKSWVYQYVKWFEGLPNEGKAVINSRYGPGIWESQYLAFDTFSTNAEYPLQYVFVDHWLTDLFIVDEDTRSKVDRLWLTILIDTYSRCILGFALQYEYPCIESIQNALKHAIWPKESHWKYNIDLEWSCYGIPENLSLDNAWAHHSHSLENLARNISQNGKYSSIQLHFRPPYKARYGGLIERVFGNLSGKFKEMLVGSPQSSSRKDIQNAVKKACLLYQDIDRIIHSLVLLYQHTPHSQLNGMTPHQKWLEGTSDHIPLVPPLNFTMDRLFWRMYPETRQIGRKGVSFKGDKYWSPELNSLPRFGKDGQPLKYAIHYNPSDISTIALFQNGKWIADVSSTKLKQPSGLSKSISLWEDQIGKALLGNDHELAGDYHEFTNEVIELNEQRLAEKKEAKRRRAKPKKPIASDSSDDRGASDDYTDLLMEFIKE